MWLTVKKDKGSREDNFTTIRVRKMDKALLEGLSGSREALWETVKRIVESFAVNQMIKGGKT